MADMRQRLDVRQAQSLVMTPQLQQAIKLLQLNNHELAEFVEQEIERNPLLERDSSSPDGERRDADKSDAPEARAMDDFSAAASDNLDAPRDDVFENGGTADGDAPTAPSGPTAAVDWSNTGAGGSGPSEGYDFEANHTTEKSLHEHLHDQLALARLAPADQLIASRLIEDTDDAGYCRMEPDEVAETLGTDVEDVLAVLGVCQGFEPTGIMARSLNECLELQLREQDRLDPAMAKLLEHLDLAARHDLARLSDLCGVDTDDVADMLSELRELNPRPGSAFSSGAAVAVAPDVIVRELPHGAYGVELNAETLPRVIMNRAYYAEVSKVATGGEEKEFIEECAADANWLIKSLDQRARTVLKVSREIVRQQDAFFAHGIAHLRPLNLKTVADAIEMHESTVSRVTSNKYVSTPRGTFELKYFFSTAIASTGTGEAHSAEAVRHRIKQLIENETPDDVLSDDQIVELLKEFGVDVARRTVAKYRESLNIPSSVQRRRRLRQSA